MTKPDVRMWLWIGLAAFALIGEVMTGTFYLLLVAVALAAGGIIAALGQSREVALIGCAVVALLGLALLRATGVLKKRQVNASRNANVNLDIGQRVQIDHWNENRTARTFYRGANWQVELEAGSAAVSGEHHITEIRGTKLVVAPAKRDTQ
jgi:membrane protein implicated in regulation of membrane protease activity